MRIVVIAGGDSAERAVSLESGTAVVAALQDRGHHVSQLDPHTSAVADMSSDTDIAVPMLHGTGGEDGVLQQQLDEAAMRYTGSSAAASRLTFDKNLTNDCLRNHGLPVADSVVVKSASQEAALEFFGATGPVVTKPVCQGSSIGVSIVQQAGKLSDAITLALQFDDRCLVESYIPGREMTVAVLNGKPLPAIEIRPAAGECDEAAGWYDYESKYHDDRTEYIFDETELGSTLGQLATDACRACGVTGIARVDFRVDPQGVPWVLEINTIPGMTSHSLVPMAGMRIGMSLGEVIEATIHQALEPD